MNGWALWQFTRSGVVGQGGTRPSSELSHLRDVSADEVAVVRNALKVAGELNGKRLIGPFINSANRVMSVLHHIREQPSERGADIDVQLELGMALDEWLVSTSSFRRRTERDIRSSLGDEAGAAAEARFLELYDSDLDFRLVWEWRNAAQHYINPVSITRLVATRDNPGPRWVLDGQRARACGFKWPDRVRANMSAELDCLALMDRVVTACNGVACQVMVDNEDAIDGAADLLWDLFAERQDDMPGGRALARMSQGLGAAEWNWLPIRWDLPTHLILQLEASREHLELPRKRPELVLGDANQDD